MARRLWDRRVFPDSENQLFGRKCDGRAGRFSESGEYGRTGFSADPYSEGTLGGRILTIATDILRYSFQRCA